MKRNMTLLSIITAIVVLTMVGIGGCGGGGTTPSGNTYTVKIVKTNGAEVDTTETPIPPGSTIQITFADAVSSEEERTAITDALALYAPDETAVDGEWAWNEDYTQILFTPARRLAFRTQYTLDVTAVADIPPSSPAPSSPTSPTSPLSPTTGAKSIEAGSFQFTTMTPGDINGDGYADLLIGAPGWNDGATTLGAAYIFNGSASGVSPTYATRVVGNETDGAFGQTWSVADVNGDGYDDAIVGEGEFGSGKGAAYIYNGSADGISSTPSTTLIGAAGDNLGYSVYGARDVNGDKFDDLIVGVLGYDNGALTDAGAIYVYYGSANGIASSPDSTVLGESANDFLGFFVNATGDVNGDGLDDLCASGNAGAGSNYANVYLGSATGISSTPSTALTGENAGDLFGFACRAAGDVNGDGYADMLVGAIGYPGGATQGALYVYYGSDSGIGTTPAIRVLGENNGDTYGIGAFAGDINDDGYDDIVVGAPSFDTNKGKAYIYHGSASGISGTATKEILSASQQTLGMTLPGADFNGDGYSDVLVGAPGYDNLSQKGAAYIYYGSASGAGATPTMLTGEADGDAFSSWVSP